jgi:hypothetical protein
VSDVRRRWDTDERGHGVADAGQFADGARELVAAMETADWVTEEPEAHLLPHVRRICEGPPLSLVRAEVDEDGVLAVELHWEGGDDSHWPEVWRVVGSFAESASYLRQRSENGTDIFDVVTGMLAGQTAFAPHGHTVRIRVTR